jgi:hypothetical protein
VAPAPLELRVRLHVQTILGTVDKRGSAFILEAAR